MSMLKRIAPYLLVLATAFVPFAAAAQSSPADPAPAAPKAASRRDWADYYLARVDADKKGYITLADAERYASAQFDRLDIDHDGVLDHDEYLAPAKRALDRASAERKGSVQASYDRRETMFHAIDQHGDGKITKDEYLAATHQHFAEIDTQKNGKLTTDELRAAHHGL